MINTLIIIAAAILNRLRGDDTLFKKAGLRGRSLYYVSLIMGLLAGMVYTPIVGVVIAIGYLLWGVGPWGRWFDLHRMDHLPRKPPSIFERVLEVVFFKSDHLCLFVRHLAILPIFIYLYYVTGNMMILFGSGIFALWVVAAYEISWRITKKYAIPLAEVLTGALCGLIIILVGTI